MYRYTRVLKGALFALLFSLSALLPSYAAITEDGPGSGVADPIHWRCKWCTALITPQEAAVSFR